MLSLLFAAGIGIGFLVLVIVRVAGVDYRGDEGPGDDGPPWRRGGGPPRGPRPRGPEPTWWPAFERDFRAYARLEAARRRVSGIGS